MGSMSTSGWRTIPLFSTPVARGSTSCFATVAKTPANVFGRYKRINYLRDFSAYRETFAGWKFLADDFEEIPLGSDDFIYADPPYDVRFTNYAKQGFTWQDQVRTAEWLSRHRGPVVLVNQATERICTLYKALGFRLSFLAAPRRISCTGDRAPAREVLAIRNF